MECINCGGVINSALPGQIVKCDYCGTSTAWLPQIDISADLELSPELSKFLKVAQVDIDAKRFTQAKSILEKVIDIDPTCWQAYANLALVKFWLGDTSYSHLNEVKEYLTKASVFSKDPEFISRISSGISFNTAQLIAIQKPTGDSLLSALHALSLTSDLRPDFPEREAIISNFSNETSAKIIERLQSTLKRDGKSFDPPKTDLAALGSLLLCSKNPDQNQLKIYIAFANYKFSKNKSVDQQISNDLNKIKDKFQRITGVSKTPTLVFSMFKGATIQ